VLSGEGQDRGAVLDETLEGEPALPTGERARGKNQGEQQ
jgi:hypothetical protein